VRARSPPVLVPASPRVLVCSDKVPVGLRHQEGIFGQLADERDTRSMPYGAITLKLRTSTCVCCSKRPTQPPFEKRLSTIVATSCP
jgi:hypothetical protein